MEEAYIIVETHTVRNTRYYTYKWQGNKKSKVFIPFDFQEDNPDLPWKLHKIKEDWSSGGTYYVRKDVLFWWITSIKTWMFNIFLWWKVRFIITLSIWGLAYVSAGEIPNWECVFKKQKNLGE